MKYIIQFFIYLLILLILIFLDLHFEIKISIIYQLFILLLINKFKIKDIINKLNIGNDFSFKRKIYYATITFILIYSTIILYRYFVITYIFHEDSYVILNEKKYFQIYPFIIILFNSCIEEYIFRDYFLNKLLSKFSKIISIIVISVFFGLAHLYTETGILLAFIFSILMSIFYIKSNSLLLAILIHILLNIINYSYDPLKNFSFSSIYMVFILLINFVSIFYFIRLSKSFPAIRSLTN